MIGWEIRALRVPTFDEVAIFGSSVSLSSTYHESAVTAVSAESVVTSSAAENEAKRVRNGPKNNPKIKVGKYGKL